jgi:hypothetical protein
MRSSAGETFRRLLDRRLSRRNVMLAGAGVLAASALPRSAWSQPSGATTVFARIEPSAEDRVIVPEGYSADVVLRWGDALSAGGPALDARAVAAGALLEAGAAEAQRRQFGTNCDGIGMLAHGARGVILCVNHEYMLPELMFPGWTEARRNRALAAFVRRHPEAVGVMQASVGLTVAELVLSEEHEWRLVADSPSNRRVTANTEIRFSGPAARHPWLATETENGTALGFGTFGNCSAGMTPWGTYLTAEENTDDFFGNAAAAELPPDMLAAHRRFGLRLRESVGRWEYVDDRFDLAARPTESFKFGWIVEIDPRDASLPIKKRTALGRFKHESATTVLASDARAVTYSADDEIFEYLYKFVTAERFDPARPERNRDLLDAGTLFVARFSDDGTGEWLPLVHGAPELSAEHGFRSQGDVVLRCREAADRVGATPLDRPEDVAVSPLTRRVYLACTQNVERGEPPAPDSPHTRTGVDGASPRGPNTAGHIIEIVEEGGDAAARTFRWDVLLLAGDPRTRGLRMRSPVADDRPFETDDTYFGGQADAASLSAFANPDNLGFDRDGNLWIVTDGDQPGGHNDGCFVCPTDGPRRGAVTQFMSGPVAAEICGCDFTPDGSSLFLTVQHPGSGSSVEAPSSRWPDGGDAVPRSSLVSIRALDTTKPFGATS